MDDVLVVALRVLGLIRTHKAQPSARTVYEDGPFYHCPSSAIPSYYDDEHIPQARRREREKARRAAESRGHW